MIDGIQQLQCFNKCLETKENLLMNVVNQYGEKWNFLQKLQHYHLICRYFDKFLLAPSMLFLFGTKPIYEEFWEVNSRRLLFRIANPIIIYFSA